MMNLTLEPSIRWESDETKPNAPVKEPKIFKLLKTIPHAVVLSYDKGFIPNTGDMLDYFVLILNPCDMGVIKEYRSMGFNNSSVAHRKGVVLECSLSDSEWEWFKTIKSENYDLVQKGPGKIYEEKGQSFISELEDRVPKVKEWLEEKEVEYNSFVKEDSYINKYSKQEW